MSEPRLPVSRPTPFERENNPVAGDWVKRLGMVWWHRASGVFWDGIRSACGRWFENDASRGRMEARPQLPGGRTTLPERFRCPVCEAKP